jgi:hypothetical protein
MLAHLFRYGKIAHHGAFYNAQTGRMSSLAIDPDQWAKTQRRNRRLSRDITPNTLRRYLCSNS